VLGAGGARRGGIAPAGRLSPLLFPIKIYCGETIDCVGEPCIYSDEQSKEQRREAAIVQGAETAVFGVAGSMLRIRVHRRWDWI
jgi:hypothetical protein